MESLSRLLEALLLAADRPLSVGDLVDLINLAVDDEVWPARVEPDQIEVAVRSMSGDFTRHGGVELVEVGGGWRLRTPPALAAMVRRLWPDRAARLSGAGLEVLSIVAYRQPCTRVEVEEVRGVDCGGVLRALLERRLLKIVGKKDEPGRPLLYGTTPEFLETFSLPNLRAMPTLRDLESLRAEEESRAAGARDEAELKTQQMNLALTGDQSFHPPSSDSSTSSSSSNEAPSSSELSPSDPSVEPAPANPEPVEPADRAEPESEDD